MRKKGKTFELELYMSQLAFDMNDFFPYEAFIIREENKNVGILIPTYATKKRFSSSSNVVMMLHAIFAPRVKIKHIKIFIIILRKIVY